MDMDLFQPDDMPLQEVERTLTCSCPKCSAKIELALAQIVDDSASNTCPACKTHYVLTKESFARRASRKTGEINCAHCGGQLDHFQYCPSCKVLYPDYYAAELPDAAKKRARQKRDIFGGLRNFSFQWNSRSTPSVDYKPVLMDSEPWQEPVGIQKKNLVLGFSAVLVIALVGTGILLFSHMKAKKQYAATYVMALYGIKSGTDLSLNMCGRISSEWAAKISSGQSTPPLSSIENENQLNNVKIQTDKYLQKLNDPPSAFAESNEKLIKLNGLFIKTYSAALKPSGTVSSFVEQTQNAEKEFNLAKEDLKRDLPAEIQEELKIAKTKYRGMSNF